MEVLGKIITYSLNSDLEINLNVFLSVAKEKGVPSEWLPSLKNKERLKIKEARRAIVKVLECSLGVLIRENGGAVFIPQEKISEWNLYQNTITDERIRGISITALDVADTAENKKAIIKELLNEVKGNLRQEIFKLKKEKPPNITFRELTGLFIKTANSYQIKIDATGNMYNRLMELEEKVKQYEKFLSVDLGYILLNLDTAIKEFKVIYDERKEEYIDTW